MSNDHQAPKRKKPKRTRRTVSRIPQKRTHCRRCGCKLIPNPANEPKGIFGMLVSSLLGLLNPLNPQSFELKCPECGHYDWTSTRKR